jgi:hypothetical protein
VTAADPEPIAATRITVWAWDNGAFGLVVCADEDAEPAPGDIAIPMSTEDAITIGSWLYHAGISRLKGLD